MGWDDNKGLKSLCSHRASDGCLGPLKKTLSGSQEVMGRVTNNSRKFLMLGKLSVLLRADMAV